MIEALVKLLPKCDFVPPFDFVKESIDSCDGLALVVTPQDDDLTWISNLQSEQQTYDLAALTTSVHIITKEKVLKILVNHALILILFVFISHFLEHVE